MADYITDPELLKQLNAPSEPKQEGYITDPELLKQLNGSTQESVPTGQSMFTAEPGSNLSAVPIVPATSGALINPQEIQAMKNVAQPILDIGKGTLTSYAKNPVKLAADVAGVAAVGVPPFAIAEGGQTLIDRAKAIEQSYNEASKFASQTSPQVDPQTGKNVQWRGIDAYREMGKAGGPEVAARLNDAYHNQGGPAGVKKFIESAEGQALAEANPAFRAAAAKYVGEIPGLLTQAARIAAPVARTALRAAGPIGMAYDVYQAKEFLDQAQLGQRLAQGEGQFAPNAARNLMLNQNVSGYQPTPQEAANLLASGDQRTINMYGGAQKLAQTARNIAAQPEQTSWIDNALNIFQRYRPAIGR